MQHLVESYSDWKLSKPDISSLSQSKKYKWNYNYIPSIKYEYPWLQEISIKGKVEGILCRICRLHVNDSGSTLKLGKSKGKFVITPFVKFGDLREAAFQHEFGTKSDDYCTLTPPEL